MEKSDIRNEFVQDVLDGLSANPKYLSSKYFYNNLGSRIFQEIMRMPEYYLTDCELEILETHKEAICKAFTDGEGPSQLIDLGAGDGMKTKILLSHFFKRGNKIRYFPVDISSQVLLKLVSSIEKEMPGLEVKGMIGDYFQLIEELGQDGGHKRVLMYLGSNIGNFNGFESLEFLKKLRSCTKKDDLLFIGFDLKKDPSVILNAYDDPHGYTAAFNLNLLRRINEELGADFKLQDFRHKETYDPDSGTAKSYIVSLKEQEVFIKELSKSISFDEQEPIFTEISQKYDDEMIESLAAKAGFEVMDNFYDRRRYFVDSLWIVK